MPEISMEPVVSDTIESVHYFPEYRDLIVRFRTGWVYVYRDCPPDLAARLTKRHPWRRVGAQVKQLPYERITKGIKAGPRIRRAKRKVK